MQSGQLSLVKEWGEATPRAARSSTASRRSTIALGSPWRWTSSRTEAILRHSSEDACVAMVDGNAHAQNKELPIVPGAVHTDLYHKMNVFPFDRIASFFGQYL